MRTSPVHRTWLVLAVVSLVVSVSACRRGTVTRIASGFDLLEHARTSIAEDGHVLAAKTSAFVVGDGISTATVDLAPLNMTLAPAMPSRLAHLRNGGDIVLVSRRSGVAACPVAARGAYRVDASGALLTTYFEGCETDGVGIVGREIGLSPNGTVAFSQITNGVGAIYRGPAAGPVSVLRSGNGTFFNTGWLDVNDAGRVAAVMEYFDGFAGGLMRAILLFATPEQDKSTVDTAIEKMGVGVQPPLAINAGGQVAFAVNTTLTFPIAGTTYTVTPGVYLATPTLFNTPKMLTLVADTAGPFCRFGSVDINDAGVVVFEAALDSGFHCADAGLVPNYDGIFIGPNLDTDQVVAFGDARLGGHQYFDTVRLGGINNAGQIAFLTTYSEPLVEPFMVWRFTP